MRCKVGDLAIIVGGATPENIGKIVEIVRPAINGERLPAMRFVSNASGPVWIVRGRDLVWRSTTTSFVATTDERPYSDSLLRPIRPEPGADETLTWKDVPSTDKVTS